MRLFEYMNKDNLARLDKDQQTYISKLILKEVDRVAKEQNMSKEAAYYWYSKGLYGGDREVGDFSS